MAIPKVIKIGEGKSDYGKKNYYYWSEYDTHEEALFYAKKLKAERKQEGTNLKYFILETQDSWFLPVPKFVVYLNKKLRLL